MLALWLFCSLVYAVDSDNDGVDDINDCDPENASVYPDATEICDDLDNDCDDQIDEGVLKTFWEDADGDGFGNPEEYLQGCSPPMGYVLNNTDCDDTNPVFHPNQVELCDDFDNNCNSEIDEGCAGNEPSYDGINEEDQNEENNDTGSLDTAILDSGALNSDTEESDRPPTSSGFIPQEEPSGCGDKSWLIIPLILLGRRRLLYK
ncbi:MAG: hypothetical protein CMK59_03355 [Proteobacteria bacterium]|nr:hypothetical protein [Pseudomonadota bacterium]